MRTVIRHDTHEVKQVCHHFVLDMQVHLTWRGQRRPCVDLDKPCPKLRVQHDVKPKHLEACSAVLHQHLELGVHRTLHCHHRFRHDSLDLRPDIAVVKPLLFEMSSQCGEAPLEPDVVLRRAFAHGEPFAF